MAQIEERMVRARIKQARKEAGLTQQQLAELLEVIPRSVQNYEDPGDNGRTPWGKINAIAKATGRTSEWILHGDEVVASPLELQQQLDRVEGKLDELLSAVGGEVLPRLEVLRGEVATAGPTAQESAPSRRRRRATGNA